jgi:hypothetical protein
MVLVVVLNVVLVVLVVEGWAVTLVEVVFIVELGLKLASFGLKEYIFNDWNNLDLFIIVVVWLLTFFTTAGPAVINSVKLFRLLRIVKLFKILEELAWWRTLT